MRVASTTPTGSGSSVCLVGNDFELDPFVESRRAREPRVAHGIGDAVAAGGIGEQEIPRRVEVREDAFVVGAVEIHAPDRDRHDLGARRLDRACMRSSDAYLPVPTIRRERNSRPRNRERRVGSPISSVKRRDGGHAGQPPPTKWTSSSMSPARIRRACRRSAVSQNLPIVFNHDRPGVEGQRTQQVCDRGPWADTVRRSPLMVSAIESGPPSPGIRRSGAVAKPGCGPRLGAASRTAS